MLVPTTFNPAFGAEDEADGNPLSANVSFDTSPEMDEAYAAEEVEDAALGIPPVDLETDEEGPIEVVVLATIL